MNHIDPRFVQQLKPGDMIVAGKNFSSETGHKQTTLAIKGAGVSCVIEKYCRGIFFRNSINIGLPVLECTEAFDSINQGDLY